VEPVFGKPALSIGRALVISDLHLGIEYFLEGKGIRIPSQWKAMAREVVALKEETGADTLIINGDLKHGIPAGKREFRDTRLFIKEVSAHFDEIYLVKGNHDGGLQNEIGHLVEIVPGSGFVFDGVGIFHGHAWPSEDVMEARSLLMGHMHPSYEFTDSIGNSQKEPCWVRGRYKARKITVMPAMSRFYGGAAVNRGEFLGPVLRSEDFAVDEIILMDGTVVKRER
jgi:putative SbcD/Mre11-related phosphoesterase